MGKHRIRIGVDGTLRAVHSDQLQQTLSGLGELTLSGASRVDPGAVLSAAAKAWLEANNRPFVENAWYAEMLVGSKQVLGPFTSRGEALEAEQQLLEQEKLPLQ